MTAATQRSGHQVLVRIPFGTVLWEEVAFRGVLLAALTRLVSVRAATATSATVFGIWHVRATLSALAGQTTLPTDRFSEPLPYCSRACSRASPASCSPGSGCVIEPNAWGAGGVQEAFWAAIRRVEPCAR